MNPRYAIGIDLGTTNSVVAYTEIQDTENRQIKLLPISQFTSRGTSESLNSLASFCYVATDTEIENGSFNGAGTVVRDYCVGELARKQAADVPARTISAAKSWLANSKVDRRSNILPWNAPDGIRKLSPVEVSSRYCQELVLAWKQLFPENPIEEQLVVLTVPASFDASARELTVEAAKNAGLPHTMILLEEPQAAVYAWLAEYGDAWRKQLKVGDILLVCDVGGGTTDFTLVGVAQEHGALVLNRIAVGNHILVGGDNMDLTLAHYAGTLFAEKGHKLDAWQSVALWHSCRAAKEVLLSDETLESTPVTILGRGSKLIGGTISIDLKRDDVKRILLDGFFPECQSTASPVRKLMSGFREIGLPYESDASITKHLAQFLRMHGTGGQMVKPTHLLFNGGVFKASSFRQRLIGVIQGWFADHTIQMLDKTPDYDYSVARGAAYYSTVKIGSGIRIRGGTARSYYVGIETAGLAVPGFERPLNALCVVPFGMEEGTNINVPSDETGLVLGDTVNFRFFSSSVRKDDNAGDILQGWNEDELSETDSLETSLPSNDKFSDGYVPVKFESRITELGMLELWCKSTISDDAWKLEFSVRE
ncbi:MAG: Hsp70 family protein [Fibrobacterota bacterium]|nr:Hsp70 family protein [Chitinispirillaceae bacterium]